MRKRPSNPSGKPGSSYSLSVAQGKPEMISPPSRTACSDGLPHGTGEQSMPALRTLTVETAHKALARSGDLAQALAAVVRMYEPDHPALQKVDGLVKWLYKHQVYSRGNPL